MARTATPAPRLRRRERKNITSGTAHVNATFNNTMITITDAQGNTIAWSSAAARASRVRANLRLMQRRSPPKTPGVKPWSTACAPWRSRSKDRGPAESRRCVPCKRWGSP